MSCLHGNHVDDCDICTEVDRAWNSGFAAGQRKSAGVTPEMVAAAEEAYMPFGDMETALNCALAVRAKEAGNAD